MANDGRGHNYASINICLGGDADVNTTKYTELFICLCFNDTRSMLHRVMSVICMTTRATRTAGTKPGEFMVYICVVSIYIST